jgi:hypothetical protein
MSQFSISQVQAEEGVVLMAHFVGTRIEIQRSVLIHA